MILSPKQREVFNFFASDYDMLFADGAVRSGKTFSLVYGFLFWTASLGRGLDFGLAGRTIGTIKRNIIYPYIVTLQGDADIEALGGIRINWSEHFFTFAGNTFYWFGGDKETSQFLIQGKTLAGLLVDESVTLLRSFVDQALARCSVEGAKIVFSCNPGNPRHFFKTDFIDRAAELNALYQHWSMDDNPALPEKVKERYRRTYSGVFYERYVLGRWVAAEGVVFGAFAANPARWLLPEAATAYSRLYIGVDFGGSKSRTVFVLAGILDTARGPELHILKSHQVTERNAAGRNGGDGRSGEGQQAGFHEIDSNQIESEYKAFFEAAIKDFGLTPHLTCTDHLEMLRVGLRRSVAHHSHRVVFVDKSSLSLGEWVGALTAMFNLDLIKIVPGNELVVESLRGLLFDPKADDDRPLDDGRSCDVDTYDATRYAMVEVVKDWIRRGIITSS